MIVFGGNNHVYGFLNPSSIAYFGYENSHDLITTSDGHGSLVASVYTGNVGDTATLTYTPDTYYGFSGYTLEGGGSIAGNTYTFGTENATAKAWFSANNYTITTANDGHGTCTCNKNSVTGGSTATLSNTPATHYAFNSYQVTGGSVNGSTLTVTSDCTAKATFTAKKYSITLQTDGHGKLTCNASTATGGQTVTLTPTYSSYYRFNNYSITGGSVNGNTLTVTANCTAKANFKVNSFTASGGFEKGSNVTCSAHGNSVTQTAVVPAKYATTSYHTSNVPTAWYSTSNRWKVTSTVSAYKITLNTKMTLQGQKLKSTAYTNGAAATALSLVGSTQSNSQSYVTPTNSTANQTWKYSKSFTSNTTGVNYGVSAKLSAFGRMVTQGYYDGVSKYIATATTGTWVATGYIP